MRRILPFGLVTLVVGLTISCDPPPGRTLAARLNSDGSVAILLNPCPPDAQVSAVEVVKVRGRVFGDGDDPVIWKVVSGSGSPIRRFTIGVEPEGFTTEIALSVGIGTDESIGVEVRDRSGRALGSEALKINQLRSDSWLVVRDHLSEERFLRRNICS